MPDASALAALLPRLRGVRVLVVGDAMLDRYVAGTAERISPEAPVPVLRVEREFDRPGGAANVAAVCAALGGEPSLLALVGRPTGGAPDPEAGRLDALCRERGCAPDLLPVLPCTVRKTRVLAGRQQIVRIDWEEPYGRTEEEAARADADGAPWRPLPLGAAGREERAARLAARLPEADVVLVSDYAKGMVDAELLDRLRAWSGPVVVDPRPQHAALYRGVTALTPNRSEARRLLGLDARAALDGAALARRVAEALEADALVTLGAGGMVLAARGGGEQAVAAHTREVFDETGAGDAVAATFALGLGAGLAPFEAARLANAAAAVTVSHIGAAAPTPDDVAALLATADS